MTALARRQSLHAPRARLWLAHGTREAEAALLAELDALLPTRGLDPALLAQPVRVVVPSRALRGHLSAAVVRHRRAATVGLTLHTLHGLAMEILDRAGVSAPGSAAAFDVLVRRFAAEEPALHTVLDHLVDGYAAAGGTVRDLLDAGFDGAHVEGVEERLEGLHLATPEERARAAALARVAARTAEAMEALDIGRAGALYKRAEALLAEDSAAALPSRAVILYGFADATGQALDLLEALMQRCGATVLVDQPRDPAAEPDPEGEVLTTGAGFTERLLGRLSLCALPEPAPGDLDDPTPPEISLFRARGATEEAREVAHRVRALLDAGVAPEHIGVVARELGPYRVPLRVHLSRLGVPFSGVGALGPAGGVGRRVHALLEVVRRRMDCPADRWLDALGPLKRLGARPDARRLRHPPLFDLRLALHALGAARVADVAELNLGLALDGRDDYPLPVRRGFTEAELAAEEAEDAAVVEGDEVEEAEAARGRSGGPTVRRRSIRAEVLERAVAACAGLAERWAAWPDFASLHDHLAQLRVLLREDLGWGHHLPGVDAVFGALGALEREFPRRFSLRYDEFALLAARTLFDIGAEPLGGAGAGLAVLNAIEARGLSFGHLFVLGLNRDVFPRTIQEDPLLPDAIRRPLRDLVPDLPVKSEGFDEERHLFGQLLSSAPKVTVSWQVVDDDGKERAPSPLVERLRWALGRRTGDASPPPLASPLYDTDGGVRIDRLLPVEDHAVLFALHGQRADLSHILPLALAEGGEQGADPGALARARLAVLDEMDPEQQDRAARAPTDGLGPYFGFVGAASGLLDPRLNALFVTTVERMAGCPWQVFLERLLRLEVPPDPMQALPGVDSLMLGNVVHAVLQRIAEASLPEARRVEGLPLEEVIAAAAALARWPEPEALEALLVEESQRILREAGIGLAGFGKALVAQARPFLDAARATDWEGAAPAVVGVEVEGAVRLADEQGREREIRFKVDRVDRDASGRLLLTDYKTGGPPSDSKTEGTRQRHLLQRAQKGSYLQAAAYAAAVPDQGAGRYLYLKPDAAPHSRDFPVDGEDREFADALQTAVRTTLGAWDRGAFFPRLVEPDKNQEPARCKRCSVAQACVRGDSGARMRIRRWAERATLQIQEGRPLAAAEAAVYDVWTLGATLSGLPERAAPSEREARPGEKAEGEP